MVSLSKEHRDNLPMPTVSICPNPPYRKSGKSANIFDFLGTSATNDISTNLNNLTIEQAWNKATFVLNDSVRIQDKAVTVETFMFGSCFAVTSLQNMTEKKFWTVRVDYPTQDVPKEVTILIHQPEDRS